MMLSSRALRSAACCAVLLVVLHSSQAEDNEVSAPESVPAKGPAYVAVKVALARSGPGLEHYATDALAAGDLLEVTEQQNGWAAIRPPVEAYSWIAASKLRPLKSGELAGGAEVTADSAKAWLGSDVEEVSKHVCQVQLRRGEVVEVIGQKEVTTAAGGREIWAKIRPPIGERRWVRASELTDTAPLHSSRSRSAERLAPPPNVNDGWTDRRDRSTSLGALADTIPEERADHNPSRSSFINARERIKHFEDEVARLQLSLTRAVVNGSKSSQIAELQHEIEGLLASGRTTLERGEAQRLLESAGELEQLAHKREELGLTKESTSDPDNDDEPASEKETAHFQLKGRLTPVAFNGHPIEMCAIMADEHTTLAFVTPAPGVNLRRYRWKEVGIIGERSYPVNTKLGPVDRYVVHRVVELDRHRDEKSWNFENVPWIQFLPKKNEATMNEAAE